MCLIVALDVQLLLSWIDFLLYNNHTHTLRLLTPRRELMKHGCRVLLYCCCAAAVCWFCDLGAWRLLLKEQFAALFLIVLCAYDNTLLSILTYLVHTEAHTYTCARRSSTASAVQRKPCSKLSRLLSDRLHVCLLLVHNSRRRSDHGNVFHVQCVCQTHIAEPQYHVYKTCSSGNRKQ